MTDKSNTNTQSNTTERKLVEVQGLSEGVATINNFFGGMSPVEASVHGSQGRVLLDVNGVPPDADKVPAWFDDLASKFPAQESFPDAEVLDPSAPEFAPAVAGQSPAPQDFLSEFTNADTQRVEAQLAINATAAQEVESDDAAFTRQREYLNVEEKELIRCLDAVILRSKPFYKIMVLLPASKRNTQPLIAVFRSRSVEDYRTVNDMLGLDQPVLDTGVEFSTTRANLVSSLVYFGRQPVNNVIPADGVQFVNAANDSRVKTLAETSKWVGSQSQQLFSMLSTALYKFDQIVNLACSEYALRSFL